METRAKATEMIIRMVGVAAFGRPPLNILRMVQLALSLDFILGFKGLHLWISTPVK